MTNRKRAFTLVELLVVTAVIFALAGVVSKLWYGMEKMDRASARNASLVMRSRTAIEQVVNDMRNSVQASLAGERELRLVQITAAGQMRQVVYRVEGDELIRDEQTGDEAVVSGKAASLGRQSFHMSLSPEGMLRVELAAPAEDRPMRHRERRFVSYATMPRENQP